MDRFIFEAYPPGVLRKLKLRRAITRAAATAHPSLSKAYRLIFERRLLWNKDVLTVSFKGGGDDLHRGIAATAQQWSRYANIRFDFGAGCRQGTFRRWKEQDASDIRIGFAEKGYWSFVGTEAQDPELCPPGSITLNLQGFDVSRPAGWERLVLHEFGHALGFHHEHQTPALQCDFDFEKLYDYLWQTDGWSREDVDFNLRQLAGYGLEYSGHDRESIMHYAFPPEFYASGAASPCYIDKENDTLSATDRAMAGQAYPFDASLRKKLDDAFHEAVMAVGRTKSRSLPHNKAAVAPGDEDFEPLRDRIVRAILRSGGNWDKDPRDVNAVEEKIEWYVTTVAGKDNMYNEVAVVIRSYNPGAVVKREDMEGFETFQQFIDYAAEKI